jgi:hypothetical protein
LHWQHDQPILELQDARISVAKALPPSWNLSEFSNIGVQILGRTRSNTHPGSGKALNAYAI